MFSATSGSGKKMIVCILHSLDREKLKPGRWATLNTAHCEFCRSFVTQDLQYTAPSNIKAQKKNKIVPA